MVASVLDNNLSDHLDFPFIYDLSFRDYLTKVRTEHEFLFRKLCKTRISDARMTRKIAELFERSWEFDNRASGGRGEAYNASQIVPDNRITGVKTLLSYFQSCNETNVAEGPEVLDVLAGDGTIARLLQSREISNCRIISADISQFMVSAALKHQLPTIRQSAGESWFSNESLDGVLIAYGTHHLDADERDSALREAHRTLRRGGRVVLHDFETGGAAARWFEEVVHPFSTTGHPHDHFDRQELVTRFSAAGFDDIQIKIIDDPFVFHAETEESARERAIVHMYTMYDLKNFPQSGENDWVGRLERRVEEIFGEISVEPCDDGFRSTIAREALIAVGTKSGGRGDTPLAIGGR